MLILAEGTGDALQAFDGLSVGPAWLAWLDYVLLATGGAVLLGFFVAGVGSRASGWFRPLDENRARLLPEDGLMGLVIYFVVLFLGEGVIGITLGENPPVGQLIGLRGLESVVVGVTLLAFLAVRTERSMAGVLSPRLPALRFASWSIGGALAALTVAHVLVTVMVWLMSWLVEGAEFPPHETLAAFADADQPLWVRVLLVISPVVGAPLVEETLFRGVLQRSVAAGLRSRWAGIVLAGALFGLVHYTNGWYVVPAMMGLGVLLGVIYECTDSLPAVIAVHGLFNLKNVLWVGLIA